MLPPEMAVILHRKSDPPYAIQDEHRPYSQGANNYAPWLQKPGI